MFVYCFHNFNFQDKRSRSVWQLLCDRDLRIARTNNNNTWAVYVTIGRRSLEIEIRHRLAMARRKIREKIREKRKTPALQFWTAEKNSPKVHLASQYIVLKKWIISAGFHNKESRQSRIKEWALENAAQEQGCGYRTNSRDHKRGRTLREPIYVQQE